jgi:hypothetical protein
VRSLSGRHEVKHAVLPTVPCKVRLEATVLRGAKVLTTIRTGLAAVTPGDMYFVTWKATARRETLSFCVRAWDAAGNVSAPSCAPLRIL